MLVAVDRDLVAGRDDLLRQSRRPPRHRAEHEERRLPTQPVELGEERRRRRRIRPVVERERDVTGPSDAGEPREQVGAERTVAGEDGRGVRDVGRGRAHASERGQPGRRPHLSAARSAVVTWAFAVSAAS